MIALLGREPGPTDGVADYCARLSEALKTLGHDLRVRRVHWDREGRLRTLRSMWRHPDCRTREWVLLQYTAFAWSRTGIPLFALAVGALARLRGARLATVFHDSALHEAPGAVGHVRRRGQLVVMRSLYRLSDVSIVTVPLEAASWLPDTRKAVTIPVGSNVAPCNASASRSARHGASPLVAVFGVTGGPSREREVHLISEVVSAVRETVPDLRLVFFGCGTSEAAPLLHSKIHSPFEVRGLVSSDEAHHLLESASAVLFVRGAAASGRTTAVSGIVAGTPLVGFLGPTTGHPITAAGVCLVERNTPAAMVEALRSVLTDETLWTEMHRRNLRATAEYFSWAAIAERMAHVLRP